MRHLRGAELASCVPRGRGILSAAGCGVPTAVLIEDEALPRAALRDSLVQLWPTLCIVGEAADGIAGLRMVRELQPDVLFVDIHLPGLSGLEVASGAGSTPLLVFTTALEAHAVTAFERGAVDYVLKPISLARLAVTVSRLEERLVLGSVPEARRRALPAEADAGPASASPLRWLQVGDGRRLRLLPVGEVQYFRSDAKYTRVVTAQGEELLRLSVRELLGRLDAQQFWQIHRSIIVNLSAVAGVERNSMGHLEVLLKQGDERLPVSQSFQSRFRLM